MDEYEQNFTNFFHERYSSVVDNYVKCIDEIENKNSNIPFKNRMENMHSMFSSCKKMYVESINEILPSYATYNKYKGNYKHFPFRFDLYLKDTIDKLSAKYSNKMIDNSKFHKDYLYYIDHPDKADKNLDYIELKKASYVATEYKNIDTLYKTNYISNMILDEYWYPLFDRYPCVDKKIINAYRKVDFSKYKTKEDRLIQLLSIYPNLNEYPTHEEYSKCVAMRDEIMKK